MIYKCPKCGNIHLSETAMWSCCSGMKAGMVAASLFDKHIGLTPAGPLQTQVGGDHYKTKAIQPVEYIHANGLGFCEGAAIKYLTRWKDKGGVSDLEKAKHFIELLIELEGRK